MSRKEEPFGFEPEDMPPLETWTEGERAAIRFGRIIVGHLSPEEPCPDCDCAIAWRMATDTHWRCQRCDPATVDLDVAACRVVGQ